VVTAMLLALWPAATSTAPSCPSPSTDPDEPWKGIATVATTAKEIIAAAGSFYNQTMALAELDLSRYDLPAKPRLAVVGTPCEIQGIRAMQARRWPTGAHRVDAVVLTIALLVHQELRLRGPHAPGAAGQAGSRPRPGEQGRRDPRADDRRVPRRHVAVDEPVKDFHGAALKGCDECADFLGRGADLSIGSVGSMAGWSSVLVRTEAGRLAFERARGSARRPGPRRSRGAVEARPAGQAGGRTDAQRKLDPDARCSSTSPSTYPLGSDREAFFDVIESYAREIWLWIIGERRWEQCVEGTRWSRRSAACRPPDTASRWSLSSRGLPSSPLSASR
jgi:coenzyme F420 hydrogenase subunit beta